MEFLNQLEQLHFSIWVRESSSIWAFPTLLVLHTIGMSIVAGLSAMVDLMVLGIGPKISLQPLERVFPVIWTGFWINAATGSALLIADATTKLTNWDFYVKMLFVGAGTWLIYAMRKNLKQSALPANAKLLAWASLICWFGAITAGRLLAYVGPVSGLNGITNK
jgi:hypothetical protein